MAQTVAARPVLDISGPKLGLSLQALIGGSEETGGVETYVQALALKMGAFAQALGERRAHTVTLPVLRQLLGRLATVRRRVGPYLEASRFDSLRAAIARLLDTAREPGQVDIAIAAFCAGFPDDREHRWVRDLAADILHNTEPERHPLMARWVWDGGTNTGVIREIWHGDDVDHRRIEVDDKAETFLVLREELSQYLAGQGVFRDVLAYVDLLTAQVYAGYISEQGGSYLRTDFTIAEDPLQHTRRMLGLDIGPGGRDQVKAPHGELQAGGPRRIGS
jgi:hypothetical protein